MACYKPVTAYKPIDGGALEFTPTKESREIKIKCGQCIGCRIERQEMWALRCYVESKMHASNCFITLTYNEDNYPQYGSLNYSHFQLFMKRLRKRFARYALVRQDDDTFIRKDISNIRFFACGEYGEQDERPHYHALLFNHDFPDRVKCNSIRSAHDIYRSETLEKLWPYGFSSIGEVNYTTARYCATYAIKKMYGDKAKDHYSRVVAATGEIVEIEPEFAQMSLRPGIGAEWLEKYWRDLYTVHDAIIVDGKKKRIPRYFDKKMDDLVPLLMDDVEFQRQLKAEVFAADNTPERLAVREQVEIARRNFNQERSNSSGKI